MANPLSLFPSASESYENVNPFFQETPRLAGSGRYQPLFDKERAKAYTDALGQEYGALMYMLDEKERRQSDPVRLQEQLDVLGPFMYDLALKKQALGKDSARFAKLMSLGDSWTNAMAERFRFTPYNLQLAARASTANPFSSRLSISNLS